MKLITWIFAFLLPFSVLAQDLTPQQQAPSGVEIIDGKKFFSLRNARRMQGSSSSLSPGAQAVMRHPRADYRLPPSERLMMTPVRRAGSVETVPQMPATSETSDIAIPRLPPDRLATSATAGKPESMKQELLSIFAPDDRH